MDRVTDNDVNVIELGAASEETKGLPSPVFDSQGGIIHMEGISDE